MLFKVFEFFANNRIAQQVGVVILILIGWKSIKWNERRKGRAEGEEKGVRETIKKIERKAEQTSEKIDEEHNRVDRRIVRSGGVRDYAADHPDNRR